MSVDDASDAAPLPPTGDSARRTALAGVLAAIRGDFASGRYHPKERLVEADLMVRYSTARGTIREALLQLDSEGLVERRPNRGARVRAMTPGEALEIAEVRLGLEVLCAGRAAERGSQTEKLSLLDLSRHMEDAARAGRTVDYMELNSRFHAQIYTMAKHATARTILERFDARPIDRFLPTAFMQRPPEHSVDQHTRLAAAIAVGDQALARQIMEQHMSDLITNLVDPVTAAH